MGSDRLVKDHDQEDCSGKEAMRQVDVLGPVIRLVLFASQENENGCGSTASAIYEF